MGQLWKTEINSSKIAAPFLALALLSLMGGVFFGAVGAFQFLFPGFFDVVPFFKSRPLHVSLVVAFIFLTAIAGIYYYLPVKLKLPLYSNKLAKLHFWIFLSTGLAIIIAYFLGKFGGREYWEFPPILGVPLIISWIIFGYNFFRTAFKNKEPWPVYKWMWGTGILFFFLTYLESNLWLLPYFHTNVVKEITMQWKSYGALVGSWNMLVYGTAIFVMEQVSGKKKAARSRLAFAMYFLGLVNLMFGWAHHIYPVPAAGWIRHFAYAISMTELLILAKIMYDWRSSLSTSARYMSKLSYKFLFASDVWIYINLTLALLISIPAINIFTHGTHITVAHAMGSTIGINTMILFSSVFLMIQEQWPEKLARIAKPVSNGFAIANVSLLIFFLALTGAGAIKGFYTIQSILSFQQIMEKAAPLFFVFAIAGIGIMAGIFLIAFPAATIVFQSIFKFPIMQQCTTPAISGGQFNSSPAFKGKSNIELNRAFWLFKMMESPFLVKILSGATVLAIKLRLPVKTIIKATVFPQFCGGEKIGDCGKVIEGLRSANIKSILDYSVEGKSGEASYERTAGEIIHIIDYARKTPAIPFTCLKMTGIASFDLLEKLNMKVILSPSGQKEYKELKARLRKICQQCSESGIPLFIDAEESWIQSAIDEITETLMWEFNNEKAVVLTTLQMYRADRLEYLQSLIERAKSSNKYLGIKLVRGAYWEKENKRALENGYPSPVHQRKEATDKHFNEAVSLCLENIDRIVLCAGTHNEESTIHLLKQMEALGLEPGHPNIYSSQLFGMSDHISFSLAEQGYNVIKYLPYGPINSVIPYLIRRAEENTAIAGQMGRELRMIMEERQRRRNLKLEVSH
jgi:nitric oxide reductase subunit B